MKKFILFLMFSTPFISNLKGQSIDSSAVTYNTSDQGLECYVGGRLPWQDINFIVDINLYSSRDTIYIDLHFLPCQIWNLFMPYDTSFNKSLALNPGNLIVKYSTIRDTLLDSNSCRFQAVSYIVDYSYHNLTILNVEEETLPQLNFFPNPVQSVLHLDIPEQENIESLKITDAFGRIVAAPQLGGNQMDCSRLPNGLYFLTLVSANGARVLRFVKTN